MIAEDHGLLDGLGVGRLTIDLDAKFDFNMVGPEGVDDDGKRVIKHFGPHQEEMDVAGLEPAMEGCS